MPATKPKHINQPPRRPKLRMLGGGERVQLPPQGRMQQGDAGLYPLPRDEGPAPVMFGYEYDELAGERAAPEREQLDLTQELDRELYQTGILPIDLEDMGEDLGDIF